MAFRARRFSPRHARVPRARLHDYPTRSPGFVATVPTPPDSTLPAPAGRALLGRPLRHLSLPRLLRTALVGQITGTPVLQRLAVQLLAATDARPFLAPERNPLVRAVLRATLFRHFCAGETAVEVGRTIQDLHHSGVGSVLLGWAREGKGRPAQISVNGAEARPARENAEGEIVGWKAGTAQTIAMTPPGQFAALKLTGAGSDVLECLTKGQASSPAMDEALHALCQQALAQGVNLVFDSEQTAVQAGIDGWTLDLQRRYNTHHGRSEHATSDPDKGSHSEDRPAPIIYGTYQAYLRSTPATLAAHLRAAAREGFTLGVKLVRGAYLASDARRRICATKADTDRAYDGLAAALLRRRYEGPLATAAPAGAGFPAVRVILATHNAASARRARAVQRELRARERRPPVPAVYAQLLGMADHVTGALLADDADVGAEVAQAAATSPDGNLLAPSATAGRPDVGKYMVWGSVGDCTAFFVRRAEENREAGARSGEERRAVWEELGRRLLGRR